MNFDSSPLSQKIYLKELETKFLNRNYDHSKPQLTGWRAERQQAEFLERELESARKLTPENNEAASMPSQVVKIMKLWFGVRVAN
jgi:hypothetical protein